jgi:uncharacterized protein YndB with AHSA1/START domain
MNNSDTILKGEREILIQAPVDEVYEYVRDFTRHTEWNYQPTEITKVSDGPMEVGTVFRTEERPTGTAPWIIRKIMMPLLFKFVGFQRYTEAEITGLEPGRRLAWAAAAPLKGGGYLMKMDWEIVLEPQNGATRVRQGYHLKPEHKVMKIMGERAAEGTVEEVDANLARLKDILEGRAAAG